MATAPDTQPVALHEATRERYLNYALSVITAGPSRMSRWPQARQRRILYAMDRNLRLRPDARYRKSAAVVGEVMAVPPARRPGIYDALVRMAQPFSCPHSRRWQGNFGSLDGDGAAAMRYTECKLTKLAMELLTKPDSRRSTSAPTTTASTRNPRYCPPIPQMLINGAEGIAVGMATRIPPHNLREVIDACVMLIDDPDTPLSALCRKVKGPDLPTGGASSRHHAGAQRHLRDWARQRQGSRSLEDRDEGAQGAPVITEVPWGINKAAS